MIRRAPQILQILSLGNSLVDLGNNALNTYRDVNELKTRYQAFLQALQEHQTLVQDYLNLRFGERHFALESYFVQLDKAVTNRDHKTVSELVTGIIAVLEQNPLHDFETFKAALNDPNFIIEL